MVCTCSSSPDGSGSMKNLNMKPFLWIAATLSVLVIFVIPLVKDIDLRKFTDILQIISIVATTNVVAWFIFAAWLWRWRALQDWLVPFPDLNGTWGGHIQTNWRDAEGNTPGPIPVILTINQSFMRMSCVMRTGEMVSHSYVEGFWIDKDVQIRRLCYSYTSTPKAALRDRSTPHDGTIRFDIIGQPVQKLEGEYWTQRQTTGTVTLIFRTKKKLDDLPGDLSQHPMTPPL